MKNLLLGFSLILFTSGCFQKIQYIGHNYPVTSNVEMFFSPADVGKDYRIIGKLVGQKMSLKKSQKKYLEIAKANGADAIIIYVPGNEVSELPHNRVITSTHTPTDGTIAGSSSTVTTIADVAVNTLYGELIKYK